MSVLLRVVGSLRTGFSEFRSQGEDDGRGYQVPGLREAHPANTFYPQ